MKRSTMAMTALGLGAAYLMRNPEARNKVMSQLNNMGMSSGNGKGMVDQLSNTVSKAMNNMGGGSDNTSSMEKVADRATSSYVGTHGNSTDSQIQESSPGSSSFSATGQKTTSYDR